MTDIPDGLVGLYPEVRTFFVAGGSFSRRLDDSVFIQFPDDGTERTGGMLLTPDDWASMVAAVSAGGETGERFLAALAFHASVPPGEDPAT